MATYRGEVFCSAMSQECIAEGVLTQWCSSIPGNKLEERRSELFGRYARGRTEAALSSEIQRHVVDCEPCRKALEMEQMLAAAASPDVTVCATCPSSLEMLQYAEGDPAVGPWRRLEIRRHADQCSLCREELSWAAQKVVEPALRTTGDSSPAEARETRSGRRGWFSGDWFSWKWGALAASAALVAFFALVYPAFFGSRRFARYAQLPDVPYDVIRTEFTKAHPDEAGEFASATNFVSVGEYGKGLGILTDLKTKYSTDPSVDFFLGYVATRQGRLSDALMLCTRAEAENNLHGYRCWYLANVALKTGDLAIARRELQHAAHHELYKPGVERLEKIIN
jgi:hypothetical protein